MLNWFKNLFGKSEKKSIKEPPKIEIPAQDSHEISPLEVKTKLEQGEPIILVDVRSDAELEIASIKGAIHVPREDVHERYKEISDDPLAQIVVFCHHGMRSEEAMHQLWGLGFQETKLMAGGIDAWSVEIDPKVPRY